MALCMTKLTACIVAETIEQAISDIECAQSSGADAVEIRLDYLVSDSDSFGLREYAKLLECVKLPVIWTLRHVSEGGRFVGSVEEQLKILAKAIELGGDYVDMEHRRWEQADAECKELFIKAIEEIRNSNSASRDVKLILSFHDFEATPYYLEDIAKRIGKSDYADVVKVACKVNNICENFYILDLLDNANKATIAIGMGELGIMSRILAGKFGAEITFASVRKDKSAAPGQLTIEELKKEYNWNRLNRQTKLAGVVGHPIGHSLSPVMHNRAYDTMNLNAVYLRFDVSGDYTSFATFLDFIRERPEYDFIGLSVTIPHKTNAIDYLKANSYKVDVLAEKIGAVNTIVFLPDGNLAGYNTDYIGVLESLRCVGGLEASELKDKRVAVLGAGGVSRAIVAAMTFVGAHVTIYNRTERKAQALARQFECECESWEERGRIEADIIINGTSIGMLGNENSSPLDEDIVRDVIKEGMIVFDTVYNPLETKLLRLARDRGAEIIDGANMLVYQAIEQIKIWLDCWKINYETIPADMMKRAVLAKLGNNR